ncbi:hypothetical protein [Kitasatospora sp. NPDC004289]
MNRRPRIALALCAVLPVLLTAVVGLTALTAAGAVRWTVLPSVLLAVAVLGGVAFLRTGARPRSRTRFRR